MGDRIGYKIRPFLNSYNKEDYYLVYENKRYDNYYSKKFCEIISEDKIQCNLINKNINNNKLFSDSANYNNTISIMVNNKEETMFPKNEKIEYKIEVEIKIVKKCCCVLCLKKMPYCCYKFKDCLKKFFACIGKIFAGIIGCGCYLFYLFIGFLFVGGWVIFLII